MSFRRFSRRGTDRRRRRHRQPARLQFARRHFDLLTADVRRPQGGALAAQPVLDSDARLFHAFGHRRDDPSSAMRAAFFTLLGVLTIATVLVLPRDADSFSKVIIFCAIVVIGLSYVGLIVFPHEALHTADSQEPEHAGLCVVCSPTRTLPDQSWPASASPASISSGAARNSGAWRSSRGDDLHAAHRIQDDGRPGAVLDPDRRAAGPDRHAVRHADPVCTGDHCDGHRYLRHRLHPAGERAGGTYFPDLTYTGRTTLWEFSGEMLAKKPWTGYGYESFWGTPLLLSQDQPFDRAWDIRTIVHGHDGYLDIAVLMGIPALCVAVYTS
ncbi:O-antigen ligase family protein [Mesorhizobium sp. C277A]